jgi:excisionase family DNA binding protein
VGTWTFIRELMMLITVAEACSLLTVSRSTFYRMVSSGSIKVVKLSERRVAVAKSEIERFTSGPS